MLLVLFAHNARVLRGFSCPVVGWSDSRAWGQTRHLVILRTHLCCASARQAFIDYRTTICHNLTSTIASVPIGPPPTALRRRRDHVLFRDPPPEDRAFGPRLAVCQPGAQAVQATHLAVKPHRECRADYHTQPGTHGAEVDRPVAPRCRQDIQPQGTIPA